MKNYAPLVRSLKNYKASIALGFSVALIAALLVSAPPFLLKILIDDIYSGNHKEWLGIVVCLYVLSYFLSNLAEAGSSYLFLRTGESITVDTRTAIQNKINRLPLSQLEQQAPGRLTSMVVNDVSIVSNLYTDLLPNTISMLFRIIVAVPILFYIDWRMSCLLLLIIPVFWMASKSFHRQIRSTAIEYQNTLGDVTQKVNESIAGSIEIRTYKKDHWNTKKVQRSFDLVKKAAIQQFYPTHLNQFMLGLVYFFPIALLYYLGGKAIFSETLTIGELVAYATYFTNVMSPINMLLHTNSQAQAGLGVWTSIQQFLDQDSGNEGILEKKQSDNNSIRIEDVAFQYSNGDRGLSNTTGMIPLYKTTVITGENGTGKTTLAQIIAGLRTPSEGRVDYGPIDPADIRYVPHAPYLFSGTIEENISFGRKCNSKQIQAVSSLVGLHPLIELLPEQYETKIGSEHQSLSAGQQQRLSIARLLLDPPQVVILDEALSNVDELSQQILFEVLKQHIPTIILISHNKNHVTWADHELPCSPKEKLTF
ncbi:ABC-type bacteriocin/lantibiotic exporter with double-glycine peptidase domain [Sporosarcina luteola]|nr:ABC-type bacteriocin/lantibiotic exporter with double-glycine peptidase domain [Sporosarcina luteola]